MTLAALTPTGHGTGCSRRELVNTVAVIRSRPRDFEDGSRQSIGVPKPKILPYSTAPFPVLHFAENDYICR